MSGMGIMETHINRRAFIRSAGQGLGLMALSSSVVGSLYENVKAAGRQTALLSPIEAAMDEDYWATIQQAFSVTRGIVNLNNGGVSPSPRMVTEAFVRYTWQQEDATAYTMWQILEPQSETIRTGLAEVFGCSAEEIAITRNASESLEILLMGMDFKRGDEILTTTQDYPRMITTLRQRELREGLKLNLIKIPIAPKNVDDIAAAYERAITPKTKLLLISHQINLTGQISPVKKVCEMARSRGIETIVDGAHSFAQFDFKRDDLGCDYFGHPFKWRVPGMDSIMHGTIHQVSKYKPWPEHKCILAHDEINQSKNGGCNNNAGDRGHEQPLLIPWIMMMVSMQGINKLLCPFAFGHPMKNITMGKVFKEAPE